MAPPSIESTCAAPASAPRAQADDGGDVPLQQQGMLPSSNDSPPPSSLSAPAEGGGGDALQLEWTPSGNDSSPPTSPRAPGEGVGGDALQLEWMPSGNDSSPPTSPTAPAEGGGGDALQLEWTPSGNDCSPPTSPTAPAEGGGGDALQQQLLQIELTPSVNDSPPPSSSGGPAEGGGGNALQLVLMPSGNGRPPPSSAIPPEEGDIDVLLQPELMPSGNVSPRNATTPAPMNPLLLASVCVGSSDALKFLFDREDAHEPPMMMPTQVFLDKLSGDTPGSGTGRTLTVPQASDDVEQGIHLHALQPTASEDAEIGVHQQPAFPAAASDAAVLLALPSASRLLKGVTAEGDTVLHVIALHGDSTKFLDCANIINTRDQDLLFVVNKNGDTPLHCAARAGRLKMLSHLIELAGGCNRMHDLLRHENGLKETALHEAVRTGNENIVKRLLEADPLLGNYPQEGTSPLYLALLKGGTSAISEILYGMSNGNLSYKGPHGKNALHISTFRGIGITELILRWNNSLAADGDIDGSTPLHMASSQSNSSVFMHLLEANKAAVYQADNKGFFPIHVAASGGEEDNVRIILDEYPSTAGLRTAQGRTFLHVAVGKRRLNIVSFVCQTPSLAWILNARDNDGNTAMHLAVQTRRLRIFCSLYANKQVLLSLANNRDETPVDIARYLLPLGWSYQWNNEKRIYVALALFGTNHGGLRWDKYNEKNQRKLEPTHNVKEEEKIKDSSQILGIGSVLIATVAFGATFAVPGGFIADDHTNRGTPTLAGRYTFDAFMMANALAFMCSAIATIGLMFAGTSLVSLRSRGVNLNASVFFMSSSVTCLAAAFALGVYMVLAPVAHATGIAICVLSPLVVLYRSLEVLVKLSILARPLYIRLGPTRALKWLGGWIICTVFKELWAFIVIFGWAAVARKLRNHS